MVAKEVTSNGLGDGLLRGPLYLALGMCAGACGYFALSFEPWLVLAIGGFVAALALSRFAFTVVVLGRIGRNLIMFGLGLSLGFLVSKVHTDFRAPPIIEKVIGPAMVEGWVTSVEPGSSGPRLRLTVHAVAGLDEASTPQHIRLTHTNRLEVEPGRFVRCWAVVRPPPQAEYPGDYPFNRQAWFSGLDGVGYVMGRCRGGALGDEVQAGPALQTRIGELRRSLARHVNVAAGERAGGFAAALASGDRSFMREEDMEALRASGLAHLLAISGLHLGIVGSLVYFSLRRLLAAWEWFALRVPTQKPAAAAAITACAAYLILSGASVSTQRAFIMASIAFLAILLDRAPLSLRTFSLALIAVLLLQPASVMTPGFQMSFAATGALIAAYEAWARRQAERGPGQRRGIVFVLKSLVLTSVIGAAATAPFALFHFGRAAPFGLAANLLAMPIITFISAPVAGLSLISWPFGLSDMCLAVFGWSLERVLSIAHTIEAFQPSSELVGAPMPVLALGFFTAGLVGACLGQSARQRVLFLLIAGTFGGIVWANAPRLVFHWSASGDIYAADASSIGRSNFAAGDGMAPLQFADMLVTNDCTKNGCGFETPSGLLLAGPESWLSRQCSRKPAYVLTLEAEPPRRCFPNASIVRWSDVQLSGAITVRRTALGTSEVSRPSCGHRPWQPCLTEQGDGP